MAREERHAWRVSGAQVERMVVQTDWDNDEAVAYLQHRFARSGVDDALARAGAVSGDEVRILELAFTYEGAGAERVEEPPEDARADDELAARIADEGEA